MGRILTSVPQVGIQVLRQEKFHLLQGKRVGLFTNPSAVDERMQTTYDILSEAESVDLVALYGAEHGAFGTIQDGEHITSGIDERTGIPVYSLYGKRYHPTAEMLADIDVMVCDIQDIGVRYYTYQWTMTHVIDACGEFGIPVVVLDRANPLGDTVAGAPLDEGFSSLVGRFNVPIQHGMTIGEMMRMHNGLWNPTPAELHVIPCNDYGRATRWEDFERPFVPTSPNIPHMHTVKQYPGACLIEGTNLSEGRGTTLPFEIVGAPFIDGHHLAQALNALRLPDVRFRPHGFTPIARKFAGQTCEGVQVHITGAKFQPIKTWLCVIQTIIQHYNDFAWLPPYENSNLLPFDRLIGNDDVRGLLENDVPVQDIIDAWDADIEAFLDRRQRYLLYP
ncbi:MAG: DUF1343 domain-containing protein [Chloroflexota bacterium]